MFLRRTAAHQAHKSYLSFGPEGYSHTIVTYLGTFSRGGGRAYPWDWGCRLGGTDGRADRVAAKREERPNEFLFNERG